MSSSTSPGAKYLVPGHDCVMWSWAQLSHLLAVGNVALLCFSFDRPRFGSFDFLLLCLCLNDLSDDSEDDEDDSDAEESESSR